MNSARLTLSDTEREAQKLSESSLLKAVYSLKRNGYVVINNIFSKDELQAFSSEYEKQMALPDSDPVSPKNYEVRLSEKRFMHQLEMKSTFLNQSFYNNYAFGAVSDALIPRQKLISSFGAVTAYPDAPDTKIHNDVNPLYFENVDISCSLPCFCLSTLIPLVEINTEVGGTTFFSGTHNVRPTSEADLLQFESGVYPEVGGCVIYDIRTFHRGDANRSKITRPLIYIMYSQSWFRDPALFTVKGINISKENLEKVPDDYSNLFLLPKHEVL